MKPKRFLVPDDQMAVVGNHKWQVSRLFELTKDFPVMEIPLQHLNMNYMYEAMNVRELARHMVAVEEADLNFPIIMDEDGEIMDGRHRLIKAIIKAKKTIKAVRFEENPRPCQIVSE